MYFSSQPYLVDYFRQYRSLDDLPTEGGFEEIVYIIDEKTFYIYHENVWQTVGGSGASLSGDGSAITNLNASALAAGTVAIARLGSTGTPSSATYLRGDGQWTTPIGTGEGVSDHGDLTGLSDDDHSQYHNTARANTWLATKSTTNLPEGTNLYFTNVRADARITAAIGSTISPLTHTHVASDITSGVISTARLGTGAASASTYLRGDGTWAAAPTGAPATAKYIVQTSDGTLSAEQALGDLATGILKNTTSTGVLTIAVAGTDYLSPSGSGASLTNLNANALSAGIVSTARLGTGTADNTNFLRGDGTWAIPSGSGGTSDHGSLTGLADDDHSQYHTASRALTWLGTRSSTDLPEGTNLYYTNVRADARITNAVGTTVAAFSHTHGATDITSGVINTARLGTGTASSSTYLRGDGVWATPAGGGSGGGNTTIESTDPATVGLKVKGAVDQTANLQEWIYSNGVVLGYVGANGQAKFDSVTLSAIYGLYGGPYFTFASADYIPLRGSASQVYGGFGQTGKPYYFKSSAPTDITLICEGAASQSANLTEWRNSDGVVLSSIDKDGNGSVVERTFLLAVGAPASVGTNLTNQVMMTRSGKIVKSFINAKVGPTGADLIVDINRNNTSIWASTPANRLKLVAGATTGTQTSFDTVNFLEGDLITIDIDQVGSTVASQDITVQLLTICKTGAL